MTLQTFSSGLHLQSPRYYLGDDSLSRSGSVSGLVTTESGSMDPSGMKSGGASAPVRALWGYGTVFWLISGSSAPQFFHSPSSVRKSSQRGRNRPTMTALQGQRLASARLQLQEPSPSWLTEALSRRRSRQRCEKSSDLQPVIACIALCDWAQGPGRSNSAATVQTLSHLHGLRWEPGPALEGEGFFGWKHPHTQMSTRQLTRHSIA